MIVIASKEGFFANRVIHFAYVYAYCKTHNIRLWHLYFDEYRDHFPALDSDPLISIAGKTWHSRMLARIMRFGVRVLLRLKWYNLGFLQLVPYIRFDQEAPWFLLSQNKLERLARGRLLLLYGWLFRDPAEFAKYKPEIRRLFAVRTDYAAEAEKIIADIRREASFVVGVHVRRGDYKKFEGGRWFYSDEVYYAKMVSLKAELEALGHRPAFVLCSNDDVAVDNYPGIKVFSRRQHYLLDFLLLTHADLIMGPPSTFSAFAAFYGNKKMTFIDHAAQEIRLSSFEYKNIEEEV